MISRFFSSTLSTALLTVLSSIASAASFEIMNADLAGEGLNDTREVLPLGGNTQTTLGEQRHFVIETALDYLGAQLQTQQTFVVRVQFDSLVCDEDTAVLGGAAPVDTFVNFPGAPKPYTQYAAALANVHSGKDLDPAAPELELIFNGDIDFNDSCLTDTQLYYGIDGGEPSGSVNFYSVVLHETVHALGFLTYMNGAGETPFSYSDPYLATLFDTVLGEYLVDLAPARRSASLRDSTVVFLGEEVQVRHDEIDEGAETLAVALNGEEIRAPLIYTPIPYDAGSSVNHWDITVSPTPLMAPFASVDQVMELGEFELAALYDLGWPVSLPLRDRDGDSVADREDGAPDDADTSDWPATDANKNNLPDAWEEQFSIEYFADNPFADSDQDGLSNVREYNAGTDPTKADSDGDGLGDWSEILLSYDPLDPQSCPHVQCGAQGNSDQPALSMNLDYFIHDDISPDRDTLSSYPTGARASQNGGVFIAGYSDASGGFGTELTGFIAKLDANGELDDEFGNGGLITKKDFGARYGNGALRLPVEDTMGRLYVVVGRGFSGETKPSVTTAPDHLVFDYYVHRLLPSGEADPDFAPFLLQSFGIGSTSINLAVDSQDRLIAVYDSNREGDKIIDVVARRFLSTGEADPSFADDGTFVYQRSDATRTYGMRLDSKDNLYLKMLFFGQSSPQLKLVKVSSEGEMVSGFGGEGQGHIPINASDDLIMENDGFWMIGLSPGTLPDSTERSLQARHLNFDGSLINEYSIHTLPTDLQSSFSCASEDDQWVCVVGTSSRYRSDEFSPSTLYAQSFDRKFIAIGPSRPFLQHSSIGKSFEQESLIATTPLGNGQYAIISHVNGNTFNTGRSIAVRRFSPLQTWDLNFGNDGVSRFNFRGAVDVLTSLLATDNGHIFVGFSQLQKKIASDVNVQSGIVHFFPNGDKDIDFGVDGIIKVPSDRDGSTIVADLELDSAGNLLALLTTQFEYNDPEDRLAIVRFSKSTNKPYHFEPNAEKLYESKQPDGYAKFFQPEIELLSNDEIILKYLNSKPTSVGLSAYRDPLARLIHLDSEGNAATRVWASGFFEERYADLVTYTDAGFNGLRVDDQDTLWFHRTKPLEIDSSGTALMSLPMLSNDPSVGVPQTNFNVDFLTNVEGILPLKDTGQFFIYGDTCLSIERCQYSYFGYYSLVDDTGQPVLSFNNGNPALVFHGPRENVAARQAFVVEQEIVVIATMDLGDYIRTSGTFATIENAGNAFYAIAFDSVGSVVGGGPFLEKTPGYEIYGNCRMLGSYSGFCGVFNDHYSDIRLVKWQDTARLQEIAIDSDLDGIPNAVETIYGLNPLDANDAFSDLDSDGISNLVEFQRGTDLAVDDASPLISLPQDLTVAAIGAYTSVDVGVASAVDARQGNVNASSDASQYYPPGRHLITWSAADDNGNATTRTQYLNVVPLASIVGEVESKPDASARIRAVLNGKSYQYPVRIPVKLSDAAVNFYISQDQFYFREGQQKSWFEIGRRHFFANDELLSLSMQFSDADGATAGSNNEAKIVYSEAAIPNFVLAITQDNLPVTSVRAAGGQVTLSLESDQTEYTAEYSFDWMRSDPRFLSVATIEENIVTFDPATLPEGAYDVLFQVFDGANSIEKSSVFTVINEPYLAMTDDTDRDGIDDVSEGLGDYNYNRVPDYLDPDDRHFLLPMSYSPGDFVQSDAALQLRLGRVAFIHGLTYPLVTEQQIKNVFGEAFSIPDVYSPIGSDGRLIEFEITGLGRVGSRGSVVIPLQSPIPKAAGLFSYSTIDGWNFVESASGNAMVASADKIDGVCPAGQHISYQPGLAENTSCILLRLSDGFAGDSDSTLNGTIGFLGGVAYIPTQTDNGDSSGSDEQEEGDDKEETNTENEENQVSPEQAQSGGGGGATSVYLALLLLLLILCRNYCTNRGGH